MSSVMTWLIRHWPRCKPYDSKKRVCFGEPVWNGRCTKHIHRAQARGEQL